MTDLENEQLKSRYERGNGTGSGFGNTLPRDMSGGFFSNANPPTPKTGSKVPRIRTARRELKTSLLFLSDLPSRQEISSLSDIFPLHRIEETPKVVSASKAARTTGPIKLFKMIMDDWQFTDSETSILLGFDDSAIAERLFQGVIGLHQRDANDRLRAVLKIGADLNNLFRDNSEIRKWLMEPQPMLNDATPRSLLTEGSMENVLRVRQYAEYLSGR